MQSHLFGMRHALQPNFLRRTETALSANITLQLQIHLALPNDLPSTHFIFSTLDVLRPPFLSVAMLQALFVYCFDSYKTKSTTKDCPD